MKKQKRFRPETTSGPTTTKIFAFTWGPTIDYTPLDEWLNAHPGWSVVGVTALPIQTTIFIVTRGPAP